MQANKDAEIDSTDFDPRTERALTKIMCMVDLDD
jgi:hypothetical protein